MALVAATLGAVASTAAPAFPRRFSAVVVYSCESPEGCLGNFTDVQGVQQDLDQQNSIWTGVAGGPTRQQKLYTVPSDADPETPEATKLSLFQWRTGTTGTVAADGCSYGLNRDIYSKPQPAPPVFWPYAVTALEATEPCGKEPPASEAQCQKWSNGGTPGKTAYWAVWHHSDDTSMVAKAQYVDPGISGSFPVPGWSATYTFLNFSTAPITNAVFAPPPRWQSSGTCANADGGVEIHGVPARQGGYLCVEPGKGASFSVALWTKPPTDVTLSIRRCATRDRCVDGLHCATCVGLTPASGKLTFTPADWSAPQTVGVAYEADGDTQWTVSSPHYYIGNSFRAQFSTCACAGGKCSNDCQAFCGTGTGTSETSASALLAYQ